MAVAPLMAFAAKAAAQLGQWLALQEACNVLAANFANVLGRVEVRLLRDGNLMGVLPAVPPMYMSVACPLLHAAGCAGGSELRWPTSTCTAAAAHPASHALLSGQCSAAAAAATVGCWACHCARGPPP